MNELRQRIKSITDTTKGIIGISVHELETGDTLTFNAQHHYPMLSTYKLPLALAILHKVNQGVLKLDQKIHVSAKDVKQDTWSPIIEQYPQGNIDLSLKEVLEYTIAQSDNLGCDLLFRLIGGTHIVNEYIHSVGIDSMEIVATEEEMHKKWNAQYKNWCLPNAMDKILEDIFHQKLLDKTLNALLIQILESTSFRPERIRGLLPKETVVAHKTGTSGTRLNVRAACNDLGIITLPNGHHVALVIFITQSKSPLPIEEHQIALISRAVYDFFAAVNH